MNLDETLEVLTRFQYYYPNQLNKISEGDVGVMVSIWQQEFADVEKDMVYSAFELYVNGEDGKYFPSINAIKSQLWNITSDLPSVEEAWTLVKKFMSQPDIDNYKKLHEVIKRAIGGYSIVKSWSQLNTETVDTSIAKQFKDSYTMKCLEEKQQVLLPINMRQKIDNIKNKQISLEEK